MYILLALRAAIKWQSPQSEFESPTDFIMNFINRYNPSANHSNAQTDTPTTETDIVNVERSNGNRPHTRARQDIPVDKVLRKILADCPELLENLTIDEIRRGAIVYYDPRKLKQSFLNLNFIYEMIQREKESNVDISKAEEKMYDEVVVEERMAKNVSTPRGSHLLHSKDIKVKLIITDIYRGKIAKAFRKVSSAIITKNIPSLR